MLSLVILFVNGGWAQSLTAAQFTYRSLNSGIPEFFFRVSARNLRVE
jgi:hypothetical protein